MLKNEKLLLKEKVRKGKRKKCVRAISKAIFRSLFFCFKMLILVPMLVSAVEEGKAEDHRLKTELSSEKTRQVQSTSIVVRVSLPISWENR